ncbi:hypothetical protein AB0G02_22890 [Actinosynnema sp. NPDC023658]|uniref:hypothetical protein n=1 Tax=Actinosynnema sp. NPDC023658 TaxID=3155465 RepID=UPI0033E47CBB
MTGDDLVAMVDGLTPAGPAERPVRHQAILLLWAIGRARRGSPRLVRWTEAREQLRRLFTALGRGGSRPTPEYPFVALVGTGWWEAPEVGAEVPAAHGSAPLRWLKEHDPRAGLPEDVHDRLAVDLQARAAVVRALLDRFFEDDLAEEALRLTGLGEQDPGGDGRPSGRLPSAEDLLRDLIGVELRTSTGLPNTVLGVRGADIRVRTQRSPEGRPVPISDVQRGLDLLAARGSVPVNVDVLGHRSTFVGAVLAALPGAAFAVDPTRVVLHEPSGEEIARNRHYGELDSSAQVKVRTEQSRLRALLAGGRDEAECALCGDLLPLRFLVAAHVKKRALCTDDERRDLDNIAMLACTFGCDSLYEAGWITVDEHGTVRTCPPESAPEGNLRNRLLHLRGRSCPAHKPSSAAYFEWHRTTMFAAL